MLHLWHTRFLAPTVRPICYSNPPTQLERRTISDFKLLTSKVRPWRAMDGYVDGWMRHARLPHPSPSPFNFKPLISPSSHFLVSLPAQPPRTAWLEGLTADTLGNKYRLRATTFSCHPSIHQGFLYILGNTLMLVRQLLIVMSYIKIILN